VIVNNGSGELSLSNLSLPSGFSLLAGSLPATLAAGGGVTTLTLQMSSALGTYAGTVRFDNNDPDRQPFSFSLQGRVVPPQALPATVDLKLNQENLLVYGAEASDLLGAGNVAIGDINGDGIQDLIVGAHGADGPSNTRPVAERFISITARVRWPGSRMWPAWLATDPT